MSNILSTKKISNKGGSHHFFARTAFLVNLVAFDIIWGGLVYFGNSFVVISLLLLAAHLYFYGKNHGEIILVIAITAIGILIDSTFVYLNFFIFPGSSYIPFWLITLWACFAATISHSLNFLENSKVLQFLIGGGLSPLSYIAGYKLGVVDFGLPLMSTYLVLSAVWGSLFIIFFLLKRHLVDLRGKYV